MAAGWSEVREQTVDLAAGTTSWEIWDPTLGDFLAEDWAIVEGA